MPAERVPARASPHPALSRSSRLSRAFRLAGVGLLLFLVLLGAHWAMLTRFHTQQLQNAEEKVFIRAAQTAHALALQVDMLVADIDFMTLSLAEDWVRSGAEGFGRAVAAIESSLPQGAVIQISVSDADGRLVYSSLTPAGEPAAAVSIADRSHFLVHLEAGEPRMFISEPVLGRVSKRWAVQFSRPVTDNGRFAGVVVLSVSPDYLSGAFREIFPDPRDIVLLARNDGVYLARSQGFEGIVGGAASRSHAFMAQPDARHGTSKAESIVDGVVRFYAFHRAERYPLTVSLGLDAASAIGSVEAAIRASRSENAVGSLLLLIATLWIAALFVQRERSTSALIDSREELELALSGADLGTWDWDVPSGRVHLNARWAEMVGYGPEELEPSLATWERLVHPDDWPVIHASLDPHLAGMTEQYESEHRMRHRDGHWVWVLDRGRVITRAADGSAVRVVGTHLDITPRKQAEAFERESRARISRLVAEVPGVVYQYLLRPDGSSSFPYASPGMRSIYGLAEEEVAISAEKVFERLHPGDRERVTRSILESAEKLSTWRCEYRVCDPGSGVRWLLGHANPQRQEDGSTLWHGYIQDVTDQHLAAEALQQSEERLRLAVEAVRDGLWTWDIVSGAITWDTRCYEMLGYADGAIAIDYPRWEDMLHPSDRCRMQAFLQDHFAQRPTQTAGIELRVRGATGAWVWVEVRGRVVAWADGRPARMVGTMTDISDRVAEAQLREVLLERSAAVIFIASSDRRMLSANARARQVFAAPGEDLSGIELRRLHVDDAHYEGMGPYYKVLLERGFVRFEYPLRDVRGRTRWFDISGMQRDPDEPASGIVWTLFDVTDRHLAEADLRAERRRLATLIERFPGGVLMEDADAKVVVANQGFCDLFSLRGAPASLIGLSHDELCAQLEKTRRDWLHDPGGGEREQRRTIEVDIGDGRALEIDWLPVVSDGQRLGRVWLAREITERKQREAALEALASTDALTGLPNRRTFLERLDEALADARTRPSGTGALLMLDIDHFKRVNDTWGHAIGDVVLQHVAEVIREGMRRHDLPGRLGGEEFAALLPGTERHDAERLAERVRKRLQDSPALTEAGPISVTISIGVAMFNGNGAKSLLERADAALYAAKSGGRNRVCVADENTPQ